MDNAVPDLRQRRDQRDQRIMNDAVVDKTWRVPPAEGMGPVTMSLRVPEVTITDPEGRFIVISPRQSELVSERMSNIADWMRYGDEEWGDDSTPD